MFSSRVVKIVVWLMLAAMLLSIVVSGISWLFI
ncbi:stressosome-associated protein Prli42 [Paenibacillus sp. MMS18-CY102]|nr:stressosome-associated protein Prli42 [Paenibacillus sp. MMS18-CY102]